MNPLQRALIEKAGHDNGFEYVLPGDAQHVVLASARHPARVRVSVAGQGFEVAIDTGSATAPSLPPHAPPQTSRPCLPYSRR